MQKEMKHYDDEFMSQDDPSAFQIMNSTFKVFQVLNQYIM